MLKLQIALEILELFSSLYLNNKNTTFARILKMHAIFKKHAAAKILCNKGKTGSALSNLGALGKIVILFHKKNSQISLNEDLTLSLL